MSHPLDHAAQLRRPQLLVRAARSARGDYRRERWLKKLLEMPETPAPQRALPLLLAIEEMMDANRRAGLAGYSIARHVEVLAAVMVEAGLLSARNAAQVKASGVAALVRAT